MSQDRKGLIYTYREELNKEKADKAKLKRKLKAEKTKNKIKESKKQKAIEAKVKEVKALKFKRKELYTLALKCQKTDLILFTAIEKILKCEVWSIEDKKTYNKATRAYNSKAWYKYDPYNDTGWDERRVIKIEEGPPVFYYE